METGIETRMEIGVPMGVEAERERVPKPPFAGIVYGEITYWLAVVGVMIALAGMVIYLTRGGYLNEASLLKDLWRGDPVRSIWTECAGAAEVPGGYWYLGRLGQGDCLAMLGIVVTCMAAVAGMWGAVFGLLRSKASIYILFALIVAVILTLSASGVVALE